MLKAVVDFNKCLQSKQCLGRKCFAEQICSTKAIFKLDPEDPAVVEMSFCNGCGDCLKECPVEAISLKEM